VDVEVEVVDPKHAIAKRVAIEKEDGVSSTALREIDLRNIVATACLEVLRRVEFDKDGLWHETPEKAEPDEVRQIVLDLVGYVREPDKRRGSVEVGP
jgi:DNA polymerase elongation subunit (family B)